MNIQELVEKCTNVSVTINTSDLKVFGDYLIEKTKKELEEIVINDKAETYLTPKQVAEMLNVDLTTLWRWNKRNYLKPVEFGGSRRYRRTEINKLMGGRK